MPKKTLDTILDTHNHFVIQVKANTSKLLKTIATICEQQSAIDSSFTRERCSGRNDNRLFEIYDVPSDTIPDGWNGIKRIVKAYRWNDDPKSKHINRKSKKNKSKKSSNGIHYYILSQSINDAAFTAKAIRSHWKIENELHWVKDVHLREDHTTIIQPNASALLAALNNLALNQIRRAGYKPNKAFFEIIKNNVDKLFHIVRT